MISGSLISVRILIAVFKFVKHSIRSKLVVVNLNFLRRIQRLFSIESHSLPIFFCTAFGMSDSPRTFLNQVCRWLYNRPEKIHFNLITMKDIHEVSNCTFSTQLSGVLHWKKPIFCAIRAPLGVRAYPWILSKYFPSVRVSVCVCVCPSPYRLAWGVNIERKNIYFCGILVVFCSYLEYNVVTPFSSHVLCRFLHTYFFSWMEVLSM